MNEEGPRRRIQLGSDDDLDCGALEVAGAVSYASSGCRDTTYLSALSLASTTLAIFAQRTIDCGLLKWSESS